MSKKSRIIPNRKMVTTCSVRGCEYRIRGYTLGEMLINGIKHYRNKHDK